MAAGAEGSAYLSPTGVSSEPTPGGDCSGGGVDDLMATSCVSRCARQPYLCLHLPLLFNAYFVDGVFNLKGPFLAYFQLVRFSKHSSHVIICHLDFLSSYLGPASCSFPSGIPSWCTAGEASVAEVAAHWSPS